MAAARPGGGCSVRNRRWSSQDVSFSVEPRRDVRARRRVGQRQIDDRARHQRPARADPRPDPLRGRGAAGLGGGALGPGAPEDPVHLPEPGCFPQSRAARSAIPSAGRWRSSSASAVPRSGSASRRCSRTCGSTRATPGATRTSSRAASASGSRSPARSPAEPALLLCDEILSALDVSVQANILELLKRLRAEHEVAMLFISHDLAVVRALAHRVGVLFGGQLFEIGAARAVFELPFHPYTHELLMATPGPKPVHPRSGVRKAPRPRSTVVARTSTAAPGSSARSASRRRRPGANRLRTSRSAATARSRTCAPAPCGGRPQPTTAKRKSPTPRLHTPA